jgi:hypothetical protein
MDFKSEMRKDNAFLIVFRMKKIRFGNGLKEILFALYETSQKNPI